MQYHASKRFIGFQFKSSKIIEVGVEEEKQPNHQKSKVLLTAERSSTYATSLPPGRQKDTASFPHRVHKESSLQTPVTGTGGGKGNEWIICLAELFLPPTADHFSHKQLRQKSLLRSTDVCLCAPGRTFPHNSPIPALSNL